MINRTSLPHVIAASRCPEWYLVMVPSTAWQICNSQYYITVLRHCAAWAVAHTIVLPRRAPSNVLSILILLKGSSYSLSGLLSLGSCKSGKYGHLLRVVSKAGR